MLPAQPPNHSDAHGAVIEAALAALVQLAAGLGEKPQPQSPNISLSISAADLVAALLDRIYLPMPRGGDNSKSQTAESCPICGLKRNAIYELQKLRDGDGKPLIKTVSMKQDDEAHGTRLYSPGSILRYLDQRAEQHAAEGQNMKTK